MLSIYQGSGMVPAIQTYMKEFHSVGLYRCNSEPNNFILANILSTNYFRFLYFYVYDLLNYYSTINFYKIL